jgi:hypothetical protein
MRLPGEPSCYDNSKQILIPADIYNASDERSTLPAAKEGVRAQGSAAASFLLAKNPEGGII